MLNTRRRRPGGRRFFPRRKVCYFSAEGKTPDYRDVAVLRRFVSDWGKIESRRKTGTRARHQRKLAVAIKRARFLALLPYTGAHSLIELGRPDRDRPRRPRPDFQAAPPTTGGVVALAEETPVADAAAHEGAVATEATAEPVADAAAHEGAVASEAATDPEDAEVATETAPAVIAVSEDVDEAPEPDESASTDAS